MAKKPDGELQFYVNFNELNKITVYDQFLLPHIDNLVDALASSKVCSGQDLRS